MSTTEESYRKIKTYKDACMALRIPVQKITINNSVSDIPASVNAYYQLCIITRALNEGWIPDLNDLDQKKWYNWFYFADNGADAGFAFAGSYNSPSHAAAFLGSRLCFKSRELANYAREQFFDLYKEYLMIQ